MKDTKKGDKKNDKMKDISMDRNTGVFTIDEYNNFPHAVSVFEGQVTEATLASTYLKLQAFLKLDQDPDLGVTLLISPKWMFLATIAQPYTKIPPKS